MDFFNMGRNLRIACVMLCMTVGIHVLIYQQKDSARHKPTSTLNITKKADSLIKPELHQQQHEESKATPSSTNSHTDSLVDAQHGPQGDGTLYHKIAEMTAPFVEAYPKQLVILGYQRVGSSFFGQMFDRNPHIFYIYEPLDVVYTEMYGTMAGFNVPSDITYYANATQRDLPQEEKDAVAKLLDDILNCRVSELPPGFILHKYWYLLSESFMPSWRRYRACLKIKGVLRSSEQCREKHISKICPGRFGTNLEAQARCRDLMAAASPYDDSPFGRYKNCLRDAYGRAKQCVSLYERKCTGANLWATKTVRGTMDELDGLMEANPNMRIIHLIRDPRPVVISRTATVSYRGLYSGNITDPHAGDIVKESRLYCGTVVRDLLHRASLEQQHPDRVVQVIYEDFVQNPAEYARAIYKYLDEEIPDTITSWIKTNTMGRTDKHNAKVKMNAWKNKMTYRQAERIVEECREFYHLLNYKWPYHDV